MVMMSVMVMTAMLVVMLIVVMVAMLMVMLIVVVVAMFVFMLVVVVMAMFVFMLVVVMVAMFTVMVMMSAGWANFSFFEEVFCEGVVTLDCCKNVFTRDFAPWSCNNSCFAIMLTNKGESGIKLFL